MIISVYSHKDCIAINTDWINSIVVRYAIDKETKFIRGVEVEFYITSDDENSALFSIDISSKDFKIHTTEEIRDLKKCIIDYITTRIRKSCNDIDIDHAVAQALHRIS